MSINLERFPYLLEWKEEKCSLSDFYPAKLARYEAYSEIYQYIHFRLYPQKNYSNLYWRGCYNEEEYNDLKKGIPLPLKKELPESLKKGVEVYFDWDIIQSVQYSYCYQVEGDLIGYDEDNPVLVDAKIRSPLFTLEEAEIDNKKDQNLYSLEVKEFAESFSLKEIFIDEGYKRGKKRLRELDKIHFYNTH